MRSIYFNREEKIYAKEISRGMYNSSRMTYFILERKQCNQLFLHYIQSKISLQHTVYTVIYKPCTGLYIYRYLCLIFTKDLVFKTLYIFFSITEFA